MLLSILENLALGFAISAVPGAVFFETIRRSLLDYSSVLHFLVGNFSGMLVIMLVSFLGLSAIPPESETAKILYAVSGLLLVYIGVLSILVRKDNLKISQTNHVRTKYSGFLVGFVLAVANPLSIVFWVSLSAKLLKDTGNISFAIISSMSVVLGAVLLFVTLVSAIKALRVKIRVNHLVLLSRAFGLLIVAYGVVTLSRML